MSGLREAVAFLTAVGGARVPSPHALRWFPLVGAAVGVALGAVWVASAEAWSPAVAAAVVVTADVALTGMLHFDGLVDSADGLLPHLSPDRRLVVMAEPGVGAFGATTVAVTVLLRWAAIAALVPDARLLAALWCTSRSAMALTAVCGRYVRPGGLAGAFVPQSRTATLAAAASGAVLAVAVAASWDLRAGIAAIVGAALCAAGVVGFAHRRIGGFTGDVLGATGVVSETAGLLVASARW